MPRKAAPVGAPRESAPDEDYRTRLLALRDRLEAALDEAGPRELAPLAARYADVLDRVKALPEERTGDVVDDLAARRARGATAARPKPAASS